MKQMINPLSILVILTGVCLNAFLPGVADAQPCEQWAAKIVSVQGVVQVRKAGETQWLPVQLNETYCPGDMVRVNKNSRAAFVLTNETLLRLNQNTTITITGIQKEKQFFIDLLKGAAHFFSRFPRRLKVVTPFVNAAVEGTEFYVRVETEQTYLSIFEGRVTASNEVGSLMLNGGQSAVAPSGQAPAIQVVVRPREAVQWALYYPPIIDWQRDDFPGDESDWQGMVRKSIDFYWEGDVNRAFQALEKVPENISDPHFYLYRAALLLSVGRIDAANADIANALHLDDSNSYAFALQSIITMVQNKKEKALELATKAVKLESKSSAARVALSYAQQAHFDIHGALKSLEEAVKLNSINGLAWARLCELFLSVGYIDKATESAQKAVVLNPNLARTQTVLGFTYLKRIEIQDAKKAFNKAIQLDSTAPLPRLGLGLAMIRGGELKEGRAEIEIAVSLDPGNSLIRSYLGKAYYEEKRNRLAENQYEIAKKLDPLDPTPWFYDAIRKQTINRPVEALQAMQKSIALNDNRAVYRSRMLLDEDLAARSASLGRIYNDLGFQQMGLVEGWKSVNTDPANYSAHRLLSDLYATLPRHKIARVSELLQSQLLQPLNITPIQPQLAESNLFILEGAGPSDLSFNEFNPLFLRNRFALQANGVAGENDTLGNDLIQSTVWGKLSYSLGQFHYETDGFRENNDQEQDIYDVFAQLRLSPDTSIQGEYRHTDFERGDLLLLFDPDNFLSDLREEEDTDSIRFGLHHSFTPGSDLIASLSYRSADFEQPDIVEVDEDGYLAEVQHLFQGEQFKLTSGIGYFDADRKDKEIVDPPDPPELIDTDIDHTNLYTYLLVHYPETITWTLGVSADFFDGGVLDLNREKVNPKFGLTWNLLPGTTLRAAAFRTFKRSLLADQTLEPTQVAGFNQFFEDPEGAEVWRYGIGIDQKLSANLYAGAEYSKRDLDVTGLIFDLDSRSMRVDEGNLDEELGRVYVYWTPLSWLALNAEYMFERFDRPRDFMGPEQISELETHRLSLGVSSFHPSGFSATVRPSYTYQDGDFGIGDPFGTTVSDDDHFWVVDAAVSYRLPKRWGILSIEAKNVFDNDFKFQDTDPANPRISQERLILGKCTLSF